MFFNKSNTTRRIQNEKESNKNRNNKETKKKGFKRNSCLTPVEVK